MSFEIIDFHIHPFIKEENNLNIYKDAMDFSHLQIGDDLLRAGISTFCGSVIKGGDTCSAIYESNRDALRLREIYGEKYIPGFHVNPNFVEESIKEIDFANENGIKLIGELDIYKSHTCEYFARLIITFKFIFFINLINFMFP